MLLQVDILRMIAEFIGILFYYSSSVLTPFGRVMSIWIQFLLVYFPLDINIYVIIFVVLLISGVFINYHWSGDKKTEEKKDKGKIEEETVKCKYCGKPIGDSEFCPYCGSRN
jgi:DNA-directed RNA polymerase subunit RPC12/RpoP